MLQFIILNAESFFFLIFIIISSCFISTYMQPCGLWHTGASLHAESSPAWRPLVIHFRAVSPRLILDFWGTPPPDSHLTWLNLQISERKIDVIHQNLGAQIYDVCQDLGAQLGHLNICQRIIDWLFYQTLCRNNYLSKRLYFTTAVLARKSLIAIPTRYFHPVDDLCMSYIDSKVSSSQFLMIMQISLTISLVLQWINSLRQYALSNVL